MATARWCSTEEDQCDEETAHDRRLRLRPRLVSRGAEGRRGRPGARRAAAAWGARQRVRVGQRAAAAGRLDRGGDRLLPPQGAGPDHRDAPHPVSRGRQARRGQTQPHRPRPRLRRALHRGGPRPGRPRPGGAVDRQLLGGAALRRAGPRSLPPLARRRAAAARAWLRGRAPPARIAGEPALGYAKEFEATSTATAAAIRKVSRAVLRGAGGAERIMKRKYATSWGLPVRSCT